MKKYVCLCLVVLLLGSFKNGYKISEGIMTLQFTYPDSEEAGDERLSGYPKEIIVYFKNGYTRAEYKIPKDKDANNTITIIDGKTQDAYSLYGSDVVVSSSINDRRSGTESTFPGYRVQTTGETKEIAGIICEKAIVTYKPIGGSQRNIDIWYTRELDANPIDMEFKGINGFIMEYSYTDMIYTNPASISFRKLMTCVKVEQTTVSDKLFKFFNSASIKNWK